MNPAFHDHIIQPPYNELINISCYIQFPYQNLLDENVIPAKYHILMIHHVMGKKAADPRKRTPQKERLELRDG